MQIEDFKKLVKNYSEENVTSDEPHVSMRCSENNISLEYVTKVLLDANADLVRVVEDRPKVYKLYYRLSRKRELKIVVDLFSFQKINVRTVKILNDKFKIGSLSKKQRF